MLNTIYYSNERMYIEGPSFWQTTGSPPFFLRDSRASETLARVKITPREKTALGVVFTRARVSVALLPLRKNGGQNVVYPFGVWNESIENRKQ